MSPKSIPLNIDYAHLRQLIADIGLSQMQIARDLQIRPREFRAYLSKPDSSTYRQMPYTVYYSLYLWAAYCRYERRRASANSDESRPSA